MTRLPTSHLTRFHAELPGAELLSCSEPSAARNEDCIICLETVTKGSHIYVHSVCGNPFHANCFASWLDHCTRLRIPATCPVCTRVIRLTPHARCLYRLLAKLHAAIREYEGVLLARFQDFHDILVQLVHDRQPHLSENLAFYDVLSISIIEDAYRRYDDRTTRLIENQSYDQWVRLLHCSMMHRYRIFKRVQPIQPTPHSQSMEERELLTSIQLQFDAMMNWLYQEQDVFGRSGAVTELKVQYSWSCIQSSRSLRFWPNRTGVPLKEARAFYDWVQIHVTQYLKAFKTGLLGLMPSLIDYLAVNPPTSHLPDTVNGLENAYKARMAALLLEFLEEDNVTDSDTDSDESHQSFSSALSQIYCDATENLALFGDPSYS